MQATQVSAQHVGQRSSAPRSACPLHLAAALRDNGGGRVVTTEFVVADNAEHSPDYLARVRSTANGWLSVPFAEEVELAHHKVHEGLVMASAVESALCFP